MPPATTTVALTGATGFVGRHVLPALLNKGYHVRVLARHPGKLRQSGEHVSVVEGGLFDDDAIRQLCTGVDAVVHLVGIITEKPGKGQTFDRVHHEASVRLLDAAQAAGVKRWVHMSALGARPDAVSRYHQTKWLAEEAVRGSSLQWTIFRPSIIHGPDGEFMELVRGFWCNLFPPFVPFFGANAGLRDIWEIKKAVLAPWRSLKRAGNAGEPRYVSRATAGRLQPVWVDDVAHCFAEAVESPRAVGEVYPLGGPVAYTWPDLYRAVRRHLPADEVRSKKIVALPVWYARLIAGKPGVPFDRGQVIMSQEQSVCDVGKAERDFAFTAADFETKLAEYAPRIGVA